MRRLKNGGVAAYADDLSEAIAELLRQLKNHGLFLVPVGELEEWLSTSQVQASKNNKRAWANAAAQRIQQLGKQSGDVWDFVSSVAKYLVASPGGLPRQSLAQA
jgi:hypothetical protein